MLRDQHDPAVQLGETVKRHLDALHMAAENVVGVKAAHSLEASANQLMPGLSDEPAWPTLRAPLLLLAVNGADPHERLRAACDAEELGVVGPLPDVRERLQIADLLRLGFSMRRIAAELGRHPSTIKRELDRHRNLGGRYLQTRAGCP